MIGDESDIKLRALDLLREMIDDCYELVYQRRNDDRLDRWLHDASSLCEDARRELIVQ